ncbi:hypothetical protein TARUN_1008 [Trichoderma arundinaceum]|uniref:AB hydrolase-1 domain-containing protein n=1 Tax=Trichoderma arundinaceum TaxID=490622 RepID=A0A395NZI6_TRIAR|nr:hypothetical protein TARUN_1008 [Trichoderma arundinaceum]
MASNNTNKPVFFIITGAWHPPMCYDPLKKDLEGLGYKCVVPHMPSMGHDKYGLTWEDDKGKILETASPYFDQGREVVLIAHSYGGIPACAATEGQGIDDRSRQGSKGGFRAIIFVAAFAIPVKGWDLLTTFGGAFPDWQNTCEPYTKNKLSTLNERCIPLLYNDTTEEEAKRVFSTLLPHSQDAFETGCDFIATDLTIPRFYVICENDLVFPISLQERLASSVPGMKTVRIAAGHNFFLGKSEVMAKLLIDTTMEEQEYGRQ